jgi:uncharacterized protein (DUF2342 family)
MNDKVIDGSFKVIDADPKVFGIPKRIKLEGDLARRLRKLNDHQQAIQQFVAMVTQQGEGRLSELVAEGRQIWSDIAKRHGIDLENVQWNLDKDGETIVPVGMRL